MFRVRTTCIYGSLVCYADFLTRFPLFHHSTLLHNVREQKYLRNRGCFVSVMGACALASARQRDGALHTTDRGFLDTIPIASETFYAAVVDCLPKDLTLAQGFDFLRACALLCITSIQYGDIPAMQLYLGHYFTLVRITKFQDETCWPKETSSTEIEERRRLVRTLLPCMRANIDVACSIGQCIRSIFMPLSFGTGTYIPAVSTPVCVTQQKLEMSTTRCWVHQHPHQIPFRGCTAGTSQRTCT